MTVEASPLWTPLIRSDDGEQRTFTWITTTPAPLLGTVWDGGSGHGYERGLARLIHHEIDDLAGLLYSAHMRIGVEPMHHSNIQKIISTDFFRLDFKRRNYYFFQGGETLWRRASISREAAPWRL
ncbi:hypothetical protein [Streptomyces sp. NPDC046751]|uniref:hypothetical protein n=1 Tax=unclassified Streptomyces TaxID=2593676 RepID=UPI0033C6F791